MFGITFRGHPDLRRILMGDVCRGLSAAQNFPLRGRFSRAEQVRQALNLNPEGPLLAGRAVHREAEGDLPDDMRDRLRRGERRRIPDPPAHEQANRRARLATPGVDAAGVPPAFRSPRPRAGSWRRHLLLNMVPSIRHAGVLRLVVELDGRRGALNPHLGYLHSGFEKLGEPALHQIIPLTDRHRLPVTDVEQRRLAPAAEKLMASRSRRAAPCCASSPAR